MFFYALIASLGLMNGMLLQYEPAELDAIDMALYTDIGFELGYGPVFIHAAVNTQVLPDSITNFVPIENVYSLGAGLRLGPVELVYRHTCFHPQLPWSFLPERGVLVPNYEGAYDTVFVKIKLDGRF